MSTPAPKSEFLAVMAERGFIHQCTDLDALDREFLTCPVSAYVGFDATADSLHVGHLLSIMALRWLQRTGNKPIALMGGGTTRIGDPSFRDTSRPLLDDQRIAANISGISQVFNALLKFGDGPTDAVMANNADWLDELGYVPFLRDFGRHFTVNRMLSFDSVKQRLEREQSLTFLEFNYMLLQAFDFVELARRHGCRLQMGGSDQWGNIVNGVELGRRGSGLSLFGLTTPLLTTASGAKMGKTAQGAVWLSADRLSAYDFWQFWRNTEDADVGRFLRLFTELPLSEIARLEQLQGVEINDAKALLADEITALIHGAAAAAAGLPCLSLTAQQIGDGLPLVDLLVLSGLTASKGEARRLIAAGGARLNGEPISDEAARISPDQLQQSDGLRLSAGRKRHVLIKSRL